MQTASSARWNVWTVWAMRDVLPIVRSCQKNSRQPWSTLLFACNAFSPAYFCLLNDKISRLEVTNSRWKSIKDSFPEGKRFRSYPSIKIGRFAVSREYRGRRIGSELLSTIKYHLGDGQNLSAFRFITVDAYLSAIPFYEKNGFKILTQKEEDEHTRLLYYDMMEV